jgi:diadenosine tetraphosphatase ApaH/serine/threonine PP2A family protein phosphatase
MESNSIQATIENIKAGQLPTKEQLITLIDSAAAVIEKEPNIVDVTGPVHIVGNIHGQFEDLLHIFDTLGLAGQKYVFLGNYVNRGSKSIEVISTLLGLKILHPERITVLRGNHECVKICEIYGFLEEIKKKYQDESLLAHFSRVFNVLPLVARLNNGKAIAVHGGISQHVASLKDVEVLDRFKEIEDAGPITDLTWADPDENTEEFNPSPRGCSFIFGKAPFLKFMDANGIKLLFRSHQMIAEGYNVQFDGRLITVYSAPNYCGSCNNKSSVFTLDGESNYTHTIFNSSLSHP